MLVACAHCTLVVDRPTGHVNRAAKRGLAVYCGRECAGLAHRKFKSKAQKVEEKRLYDMAFRAKNLERIKAEKAAYFRRTYDPIKAAVERKKTMARHVEYCRRPEYRAQKSAYDRQYRAEKEYGEFADCFLLVMDIRNECLSQMSDYEIRFAKGGIAKSQQRKRADDQVKRALRKEPEVGPVGHLERGQGWQNGGLASGLRRLSGA